MQYGVFRKIDRANGIFLEAREIHIVFYLSVCLYKCMKHIFRATETPCSSFLTAITKRNEKQKKLDKLLFEKIRKRC